jgi:Tol biopolymer transport system component
MSRLALRAASRPSRSRARIVAILVSALAALATPSHAQQRITAADLDPSGALAPLGADFTSLSGDGRYVAYDSMSSNLVSNDTNGVYDVFVRERATGATVRVSVDSAGNEGDSTSFEPSLSYDGRYVAFVSFADNLVANDTNGTFDVFVHDRDPDGNGIFDEGNGVTTRVSVDSNGVEADDLSGYGSSIAISGDGMKVVFASGATNLDPSQLHAGGIFLHDLSTGATVLVDVSSAGVQGNGASGSPRISRDGTHATFSSASSDLVAGDLNGKDDIFVRDLVAGTTTRVSINTAGNGGNGDSRFPVISADGSVIAFGSSASNLVSGDTNFVADVFVRDQNSGTTTRVSVDSSGKQTDNQSWSGLAISDDGTKVAFFSDATNLVPNDKNFIGDVFLHDRTLATTELVSSNCFGTSANDQSGYWWAALSADGGLVAFESYAYDLVGGDTNASWDVFVCDRSIPWPVASWSNYGAGFPGTLGIPGLTSNADPQYGATITIAVDNSLGADTVALLLPGLARASIPTSAGGTILVSPLLFVPVSLPAAGLDADYTVPHDPAFCGFVVDLQALEIDAGAAHGLSFTAGLELLFGM